MVLNNGSNNVEPRIEIDGIYGCPRVNGILFPRPTSFMPPMPPPSPPPPEQKLGPNHDNQQEYGDHNRPYRKKRHLTASQVVETKKFSLRLYRSNEPDYEFILEMHEVATGEKTFYALLPYNNTSGKSKMEARGIASVGLRVGSPTTAEVYPQVLTKYDLTMEERLRGPWTVEVRERTGTSKTEKFYFHEKLNKTFRSFNDVATFVMYRMLY